MNQQPYSTGLPENLAVQSGQTYNKALPLSYNGVDIRDQGEMLSLTDMWKAAGSVETNKPSEWLRSKQAKRLMTFMAEDLGMGVVGKNHFGFVTSTNGGSSGGTTFGHWHVAFAYAKYLSPQFHVWCNQIVRERMENRSITPSIPQSMVEALRFAADAIERAETAERTKAEIGTRREATAMNTASQAVKKVSKLELELDRSQDYATVKRMEKLWHGIKFSWRELKSVATEMGISPIDVFDANYGTVKAYHADVWQEAYALEIPNTIDSARSLTEEK